MIEEQKNAAPKSQFTITISVLVQLVQLASLPVLIICQCTFFKYWWKQQTLSLKAYLHTNTYYWVTKIKPDQIYFIVMCSHSLTTAGSRCFSLHLPFLPHQCLWKTSQRQRIIMLISHSCSVWIKLLKHC